MHFLKKYNKSIGVIGCALTMIAYTILLCIGTGVIRAEFNFVTHALIPIEVSKIFVLIWCLYYALSRDYDTATRIFAKNLFVVIIVNMVITALDYEMDYFFLVQSVTSLLLIVLMVIIINQRRFAIRSKSYSSKLYVINTFLCMCIAGFALLIFTSFKNQYVYLFTATIISQAFTIIAIYAVNDVEKKFQKALRTGGTDSEEVEFSD